MIDARRDVLLAACLVGVSVAAWLWLHGAMQAVDSSVLVRHQQLEQLTDLRRRAACSGLPTDVELGALHGLFAGYDVAVAEVPAGSCLVLCPSGMVGQQ